LATPTDPHLRGAPPHYPRIREIARAWAVDDQDNIRYFLENRAHHIFTYQDAGILEELKKYQITIR
jgi:hypothetical protein